MTRFHWFVVHIVIVEDTVIGSPVPQCFTDDGDTRIGDCHHYTTDPDYSKQSESWGRSNFRRPYRMIKIWRPNPPSTELDRSDDPLMPLWFIFLFCLKSDCFPNADDSGALACAYISPGFSKFVVIFVSNPNTTTYNLEYPLLSGWLPSPDCELCTDFWRGVGR